MGPERNLSSRSGLFRATGLRGRLCGDNRALFARDGALPMGELFCLLLEALVGLGMSKNPLTWDSTTPQGIRAGLSVIVTVTPLSCIKYVPFTPLPEKLPDVVSPLKSTPYFLMPCALATKVLGRSVLFTQIVIDKLVSLSHPHC